MLCKVCGSQIPDDAKECEFCGAKTDENTENNVDDATKVIAAEEVLNNMTNVNSDEQEEIFDENEKKRREQVKKMMEDKQKQLSEIEKRRSEKRKRQKRNKILLIALICALAIGAAGAGAYYVMQNVNSPVTVTETPTPAPTEVATPPAATATPASTSLPASPAPTGALAMTPAPNTASASASGSAENNNQSWTATGNSGSGSSSSSGAASQRTASNTSSQNGSSVSSGSSSASGGASSSQRSSSSASNSGIVNDKISAGLITGGEVIYNTGTGRYLMTFTKDGVKYYANVSEGSTTEQIQNKAYTINADPTSETYNGNTVYEISSMTNYEGDYILANSGTKLLTESDIKGMSKYDLALARNEIYARHGRKFQTKEYNDYFGSKSWYKINPNYNYSDDNSNLNDIETRNVQLLLNAERR